MVNEGKTPEEAIEALRWSWRILHEKNLAAWDKHLRQQQEDLERDGNGGNGAMADTPDSPTLMDDKPEWLESTPSFIDVTHENNLSDICTNHYNIQSPEPGREWKIREVR